MEFPHFETQVKRYMDAADVVGLGVDKDPTKSPDEVAAWMKEKGLTFPTLLKAETIDKDFEVAGYPAAAIVDKKGILRYASCGYSPFTQEAIALAIEDLRREAPEK